MGYYTSFDEIKAARVKCDMGKIGWDDEKGNAVHERAVAAYALHDREMSEAESACEQLEAHCRKMADLLEKKAPSIPHLARL